jgi:hypothetical protein
MLCEYVTPSRLARAWSVVKEDRFTVTEFFCNQRLSLFTKSIAPDRDNCQTVALMSYRREYLKQSLVSHVVFAHSIFASPKTDTYRTSHEGMPS